MKRLAVLMLFAWIMMFNWPASAVSDMGTP